MTTLRVNEVFDSIQGEGSYTGWPMTFLRLQGCNLRCPWCDTVRAQDPTGGYLASTSVVADSLQNSLPILCVTGGEPLMQMAALQELRSLLAKRELKWHVETNGTLPIPVGVFDWVSVSPKPPRYGIHPDMIPRTSELKLVVTSPKVLRVAEAVARRFPKWLLINLQPVDNDPSMVKECVGFLMQQRDEDRWRLSIQVHKLVNLP